MRELDKCLVCSGTDFKTYLKGTFSGTAAEAAQYFLANRRAVVRGTIKQCQSCGFKFTSPQFEPAEYDAIYKAAPGPDTSDISMVEADMRRFNRLARLVREDVGPSKHFLDFGCGEGGFLRAMNDPAGSGFEVGDPSTSSAGPSRINRGRFFATIGSAPLEEGSFDLITSFDVFEHLPELDQYVAALRRLLVPDGGHLIVTVPDADSLNAKLSGSRWNMLLLEHLWYFNEETLKTFMERAGFRQIRHRKLPYDASLAHIARRAAQTYKSFAPSFGRALSRVILPVPVGLMYSVFEKSDASRPPSLGVNIVMADAGNGAADEGAACIPLVVDVDGTLIKTDLLHESALQFLARHPLRAWQILHWLLRRGKAELKARLAERAPPDLATLPLREETLALVKEAQAAGRPVYLASASDRRLVEALAQRIGGFSDVYTTDRTVNLAGEAKAARLVAELGEKGFDYIGDRPVDYPIWRSCRTVLAVSHSRGFSRRLMRNFPEARIVASPRTRVRDLLKALRPHQWSKNVLVFVALIAGHRFNLHAVLAGLGAFVSFSLAASSAYIINDLLDLPADRAHPRKRNRPFASGAVPVFLGSFLAVLLAAAAFALSFALPWRFSAVLLAYLAGTLAYSCFLKRKPVVDIVVLGGLYTLRVLGGLASLGAGGAPWLLMFSLFLFTSLAIVKRCSELTAQHRAGERSLKGRGYQAEDLRVMFPFGAAAGYSSVLVFALYLSTPEVRALYTHPNRLWLISPFLIYWLCRLFILSNRDMLHDDPVVFALTDRVSLATGACIAAVLLASI